MLRILAFDKQSIGTRITVESDEFMPDDPTADIVYFLADGILETYLDHYGFPAGASLTALLLDAFYEDIEMPHWENDYEDEFKRIVALGPDRIEWQCDKNELLAAITMALDDPESVAGSWVAIKQDIAAKAEGFQQLQEERLADEFVSEMPRDLVSQPRDQGTFPDNPAVGLAIQFVP